MYNTEINSHASKAKDVEVQGLVISAILTYMIQSLSSWN